MKYFFQILLLIAFFQISQCLDVISCEGFIKTSPLLKESLEKSGTKIDFSSLQINLYTKQGIVKDSTTCSPTGYYVLPIYDVGEYYLGVSRDKKGWNFEKEKQKISIKESGETTCRQGNDINFILGGFNIHGRVNGYRSDDSVTPGPEGVIVNLHNSGTDKLFDTTKTEEDGFYKFSNVVLGKYSLKITHKSWTMEEGKSSVDVFVSTNGLEVKKELRVLGYDVNGKILSEGLPMIGVRLYIFPLKTNGDKSKFAACRQRNTGKNESLEEYNKNSLCSCTSDKFGLFKFIGIPNGDYLVKAYYKGFFIAPKEMKINVDLGSVNIEKNFEVRGFSVTGFVHKNPNKGVPDAEIFVNGKKHTTSAKDGSYTLTEMKSGYYNIEAKKKNHKFLPRKKVHITPNLGLIKPILLTHYTVCGTVLINSEFTESKQIRLSGRKIMLSSKNYKQSTQTNESGEFCFHTRVGVTEAVVEPVISIHEKKTLGLVFSPNKINIKLENKPLFNLVFKQTFFRIRGKVLCLKQQCDSNIQIKLFKSNLDGIPLETITELQENNEFEFKDLFIGKYVVSIVNDAYCFEKQSYLINLNGKDKSIVFKQQGYKMNIVSSHDSVSITVHHDLLEPKNGSSKVLSSGRHTICLSNGPGIYKVIPKSCYKFDQQTYIFNTKSPEQIMLEAVNVLVVGKIKVQREGKKFKYAKEIALKIKKIDSELKSIKGLAVFKSEKNSILEYEYQFWTLFNEEVEVTPESNLLLFYPSSIQHEATKSTCPQHIKSFNARKGLFIQGIIFGGVPDVNVDIFEDSKKIISIVTDKDGKYKAGPLYDDKKYTVKSFKEGYYLIKKSKYNFLATKLSTIEISVKDLNENPIEGVFLSLSGDSYRSNSLSPKNGSKIFKNLYTGAYFLRPVLKEYSFNPKTYSFFLGQGETKKLEIKAKRIGYSCFGRIRSLNGLPEKSVIVQALSEEEKKGEYFETVSDSNGNYRIRGLKEGHKYEIKIKQKNSERSSPKSVSIKMEKKDIKDINFIAFRNDNKIRISGYIDTKEGYAGYMEVQLLTGGTPSYATVLQSTTIGDSRYFQFTTQNPSRIQHHYLRVVSKLNSRKYDYEPEIVQVQQSKLYNNILKFEPKPKSEQEVMNTKPLYGLIFCGFWFVVIFYWNEITAFKNSLLKSNNGKKRRKYKL